ncbi:hypothetical protein Vadar_015680 [Vaccinium darrowii]|uniref:Uncharacterized protein n=1 Tax=Vaccinium darrowii TaxID=229202 RepID=A0ACB7X1J7_9ERIC|nr:hypothetical protein Vadar_015680 [Vaccinium darrowii]
MGPPLHAIRSQRAALLFLDIITLSLLRNLVLRMSVREMLYFDASVAKNEEAIRIDPHFAECNGNMANALKEKGSIDLSIRYYLYAIDVLVESFARCLRVSELVGLDCMEQYLPHRVSMQFGMDQDVPRKAVLHGDFRRASFDLPASLILHISSAFPNLHLFLPSNPISPSKTLDIDPSSPSHFQLSIPSLLLISIPHFKYPLTALHFSDSAIPFFCLFSLQNPVCLSPSFYLSRCLFSLPVARHRLVFAATMADMFTLFVDNLPRDMDAEWLRQIFSSFGRVEDVYIPSKRSSTFNTKFGFVRFKRNEEATQAIDALNGFLIRNFNILVQFAKYSKSSPSRSDKNNSTGVHSVKPDSTSQRWKPILSGVHCNQSTSYPITYADILKGKSNGKAKMVEVKESGLDWLHMSAVGILNSYCDVNSLQDFFITNGIWDAHIRSLGGLNVLLSFDSSEPLNSFLEDKDRVLPKWFSSVEAWANQSIKSSSIGKLWGDVIKLDEFTENSIAFDKGRMFILTDFLDCINKVVHVKINDDIYLVKVIEDPMAETCWEKRVFTSIKINRKLDSDRKENVVEIDPLDDDSIELDDLDAQEEIIGVNSKMDLLELELDNKHYNPDDLGLCDGSRAGVFEKESNVVGEYAESVEKSSSHEKFLGAYSDDSNSIDKMVSGVSDYDDSDLISNEPLINWRIAGIRSVYPGQLRLDELREIQDHSRSLGSSSEDVSVWYGLLRNNLPPPSKSV